MSDVDFFDLSGGTRRVRDSRSFQQTRGLGFYPQAFLIMVNQEMSYISEKGTGMRV